MNQSLIMHVRYLTLVVPDVAAGNLRVQKPFSYFVNVVIKYR